MTKQDTAYCQIQEDQVLIPVMLLNNQLIEAKKDIKKSSKSKTLVTLTKDLTFSITKTQILSNKKYKFSMQLKLKAKQTINIIIDGKQDFQFFFKKFSEFGMASGLQQMIVSCEKIGEGSFAQVYKAITNYDSVMALKAFDKKSLRIHKNKMAFNNQIDIMRQLNSKYIVSLEGLFETEKNIYMKMQYFSLSLKQYIKKNISIKIQKKIMKQLLEALVEMKKKNIIHRDLKPQNVMIRGKSQSAMECVVIDFGLATVADLQKYLFNRCGTPGFLAPEIAKMSTKKFKLTPACDMFGLGCIFYRLITKKYVFSATNYNQVIEKNKLVQIPWDTFNFLSENQKDLITKMLQKDPVKRIIPEQALNHSYFIEQIDDQDEIPFEGCDLIKKMKCITNVQTSLRKQSISSIMSSFHSNSKAEITDEFSMTGAQSYKFRIKDSCISFEGPVKDRDGQNKQKDFKQATTKNSRIKKRKSRFSQTREKSIL